MPDIFEDKQQLRKFMGNPTKAIAETFLGIMKTDKGAWLDSGVRLFDSLLKNRLIQQLVSEIERYQSEGKVKMDYMETDNNRMALKEVLKIIDEAPPDEEKFKAIKSLFLCNVEEGASGEDQMLTYQYLLLVNLLNSGEVMVLKAIYNIAKGRSRPAVSLELIDGQHRENWYKAIARQAGFNHVPLSELYAEKLMALRLIDDAKRQHLDLRNNNMLTSLGLSVCEFITKYE